jgi:hypothetical protein
VSNLDDVRRATDEFEDIAALIDDAGGSACLYGVSSCGALALEAAAAGLPVTKVGAFEVLYDVYPGAQERHSTYCKELGAQLAEDRREAAFELFMRPPARRRRTIDSAMAGLASGFFDAAADALVAAVPRAERDVIQQEGHVADPKAVAPILQRFFGV